MKSFSPWLSEGSKNAATAGDNWRAKSVRHPMNRTSEVSSTSAKEFKDTHKLKQRQKTIAKLKEEAPDPKTAAGKRYQELNWMQKLGVDYMPGLAGKLYRAAKLGPEDDTPAPQDTPPPTTHATTTIDLSQKRAAPSPAPSPQVAKKSDDAAPCPAQIHNADKTMVHNPKTGKSPISYEGGKKKSRR